LFIRIVNRQIDGDVAVDFKLLKSYRKNDRSKQKHFKTWTVRNSDAKCKQASLQFIEDVRWDLNQIAEAARKRAKLLNTVKKLFVLHGVSPKLRR